MGINFKLLIIFLVGGVHLYAQDLPEKINRFVPENHAVLEFETGDLNLDGLEDVLLALRVKNEDSISLAADSIPPRPLLILLKQSDSTYKIASQNRTVIYCLDCGGIFGDPFAGLEIKENGSFIVYHYGGSNWRWGHDITFKYEASMKNWILESEKKFSYHTFNIDSTMETTIVKQGASMPVSFHDYKGE